MLTWPIIIEQLKIGYMASVWSSYPKFTEMCAIVVESWFLGPYFNCSILEKGYRDEFPLIVYLNISPCYRYLIKFLRCLLGFSGLSPMALLMERKRISLNYFA